MFSNSGTSKNPKPSYYLPNRISKFLFSVFKMIGREHQASLNLPSFGFSKVCITFIQGSGLGSHPNTLESSLASPPKKNSCISGLYSNLVTGRPSTPSRRHYFMQYFALMQCWVNISSQCNVHALKTKDGKGSS